MSYDYGKKFPIKHLFRQGFSYTQSIANGTKHGPDTQAPNHLSKTQPKLHPQQPAPDQTAPTRRYCNLAIETGARASEQWAVVRDT